MKYILVLIMLLAACAPDMAAPDTPITTFESAVTNETAIAYFSGGCFWCTEADTEKLAGVQEAVSGFLNGDVENPTYKEVTAGDTGHREGVKVLYDPSVVSYEELVLYEFLHMDPTDPDGSFSDRGFQYTSAIYFQNEEERAIAESVKRQLQESGFYEKEIVTPILAFESFYEAEEYHQDYYEKNPIRYGTYRRLGGREGYVDTIAERWEDFDFTLESAQYEQVVERTYTQPSDDALKEMLTPIQYKVTRQDGTETPFDNEYWDNKEDGIYVDVITGEPLFSSKEKYVSGTGWPSFWKPLVPQNVVEKADYGLHLPRTEIRSVHGDNHIGHVFTDGPAPTGLRYCMNSAAMRFIPVAALASEGYGEFLSHFE